MFLVQETKLITVTEAIANSMWRLENIGFSYAPSDGMESGILTMWNLKSVMVLFSFCGEGYLRTKVRWKGEIFYVVNVCLSCLLPLKRILWKSLLDLKCRFTDGEWIFGGDLNAVKRRDERIGRSSNGNSVERRDYSEFIEGSGLIDVSCEGKRFSWFSADGLSKSRIDRFLVSASIISSWGIVGQFIR